MHMGLEAELRKNIARILKAALHPGGQGGQGGPGAQGVQAVQVVQVVNVVQVIRVARVVRYCQCLGIFQNQLAIV